MPHSFVASAAANEGSSRVQPAWFDALFIVNQGQMM